MSFAGKRVLTLESRRASETAELIRRNGGEPVVAPSVREVPIEDNPEAFSFGERLLAGAFDGVIFLTGVGARYLLKVLATRFPQEELAAALRNTTVIARGPKPAAALREAGIPVSVNVPEPNTWRELLAALEDRPERRIAVQLYGKPAPELVDGLRARGVQVTEVPIYQWAMPEDLEPLRDAVTRLSGESVEVTLWTTGQQLVHLLEVARNMDLYDAACAGIRKSVIGSIGPTTSQTLREHGFEPDVVASHPKLGFLVKETAEQSGEILWNRKKI